MPLRNVGKRFEEEDLIGLVLCVGIQTGGQERKEIPAEERLLDKTSSDITTNLKPEAPKGCNLTYGIVVTVKVKWVRFTMKVTWRSSTWGRQEEFERMRRQKKKERGVCVVKTTRNCFAMRGSELELCRRHRWMWVLMGGTVVRCKRLATQRWAW